MATTNSGTSAKARIRFPDPPERTPDDMTSIKAIHLNGKSHALRLHFADRPNTIIDAEHYISPIPTRHLTGVVYPDLLIAFDANPEALDKHNAYIISEQGKPPDFILEVASRSTRAADRTTKRDTYARLEATEFWRFDEDPTPTNPALAGDRLINGAYQPITIDTLPDGRLRGHSAVLNLILEWHEGRLNWIDPVTEEHIPTFETEREGRLAEREAKLEAEARNRELEAELRSLRGE